MDNDPIVLAHARALLTSTPEGATAYIDADAQDTDAILRSAAQTLDFSKPIAVMALMILQYVPDSDHPQGIVRRLMQAVPSGSYLAISDTTRDIDTERVSGTTAQLNTRMGPARLTLRSRDEIAGFVAGLELVDPGLVPLPEWRAQANPTYVIPCYAAVARKP